MKYSPIVAGIKFAIHNEKDCIEKHLLRGKPWNKEMIKYIIHIIKKRKLSHFLNVGCHIGSVCLPVSLHINKVTAVEAFPETYEHLCENIQLNNISNINTHNIALGNCNETIYFMTKDKICPVEKINRLCNNSGGMHVFTENDIKNNIRSANLTDKIIQNKMTTLDNLEIDKFDIMLIDIEGCEYDFMLGAKENIKKYKPIIIVEIWDNNKRNRENMTSSREEVVNYIESLNYRLVKNMEDDFIFFPC